MTTETMIFGALGLGTLFLMGLCVLVLGLQWMFGGKSAPAPAAGTAPAAKTNLIPAWAFDGTLPPPPKTDQRKKAPAPSTILDARPNLVTDPPDPLEEALNAHRCVLKLMDFLTKKGASRSKLSELLDPILPYINGKEVPPTT